MRHLLKLSDWSKEEILEVLDLADKLKDENKRGIEHHHLKGKTLGMIFAKSSTRTRVSFQVGIYQLGGQGISSPPVTFRSAAASLFRIQPEFSPAISTVL